MSGVQHDGFKLYHNAVDDGRVVAARQPAAVGVRRAAVSLRAQAAYYHVVGRGATASRPTVPVPGSVASSEGILAQTRPANFQQVSAAT